MLCRSCGNEMNPFEYCDSCNQAVHWKCSACQKENDKSIHIHYEREEVSKLSNIIQGAIAVSWASGLSGLMLAS
jgi:hypothetical protein